MWLVNERPSARCCINDKTKNILHLEWRKIWFIYWLLCQTLHFAVIQYREGLSSHSHSPGLPIVSTTLQPHPYFAQHRHLVHNSDLNYIELDHSLALLPNDTILRPLHSFAQHRRRLHKHTLNYIELHHTLDLLTFHTSQQISAFKQWKSPE